MPEAHKDIQTVRAKPVTRPVPSAVLITIVLATMIRIALVFQGQYLFPDENRYDRALDFWQAVSQFEPAKAMTVIYKAKGRPGAIVAYLPPALMQWSAHRLFGLAPIQTSWIPGLFTVVLAGVNTLLLWKLSLKLFGSTTGSTLCAILYGLFAPGLYYVQFLLPYIAAQTYLLACLSVLPKREEAKPGTRRLLLSGVLFGCGFATYPGLYDQAVVVAVVALVLWWRFSPRELVRMLWVPVGVGAAVVLWELASRLGWGPHYFQSLNDLQKTIVQGDFSEVWRLPADFLWTADPLLSVILLIGLLAALKQTCFALRANRVLAFLFTAVLGWYGFRLLLAALGREVLYGRLVYQVLPSLCLIAGMGLSHILKRWADQPRKLAGASLILSFWAVWNVWPFFQTSVPDWFEWRSLHANSDYRVIAYVTSIEGTGMMADDFKELDKRLLQLLEARPQAATPIILANTQAIYPVSGFSEPADLRIIEQARHPLNIRALQFEAWNPRERTILRSNPLRIMLLEPPSSSELQSWLERWGGYKKLEVETQQ